MLILIVDGSTVSRQQTIRTLSHLDCVTTIEAEDAEQGLKAFQELRPDVILSDWDLPHVNGLELLKTVRKFDQRVPFIITTASGGIDRLLAALEAGVTDFLGWPNRNIDLRNTISVWVRTFHNEPDVDRSGLTSLSQELADY